jgi:hypothetical protein
MVCLLLALSFGCKPNDAPKERLAMASASAAPSAAPVPAAHLENVVEPCGDFAKAKCAREEKLLTYWFVVHYGTREHCEERLQQLCLADARLPGMKLDAAAIRICAAGVDKSRSFDTRPLDCKIPNGVAAGNQPCIYDEQCNSGWCEKARDALRGFCAASVPSKAGDLCPRQRCGPGLACRDGKCVEADAGEPKPCGDRPCGGTRKAGAPCEPWDDPLDSKACAPGLVCGEESKRCMKVKYGALGGPCEDGCKGGRCVDGLCMPYFREGEPCEFNLSPRQCEPPALCFEGHCAIDPSPKPEL